MTQATIFENARLLAFKLAETLHILFRKIDRQLQVLAMHAAVGADLACADSQQALPNRHVIELKGDAATGAGI